MKATALLDSNVLIAALVIEHPHHDASLGLVARERGERFAIAAHSHAEAHSTITRLGARGPYHFAPSEAWSALEGLRRLTDLVGLTPSQTLDSIRRYAQSGGVGARLHDALIGETAIVYGIPAIVTWTVGHMRGLFAGLKVVTPVELAAKT